MLIYFFKNNKKALSYDSEHFDSIVVVVVLNIVISCIGMKYNLVLFILHALTSNGYFSIGVRHVYQTEPTYNYLTPIWVWHLSYFNPPYQMEPNSYA